MSRAVIGKASVLAVILLLALTATVVAPQGNPPQITDIDFPSTIQADGNPAQGLIFFEDPDGDVVKAKFELVEGNRSALQLSPGWEFDPGVKGQAEGVIEFQVAATAGGSFKLQVVLEDEAGNTSEPVEFAFETVSAGPPPPTCTVTVQPDQSIQEAIDAAGPGDVICLGEGEWQENLVIEKGWQSLTLRGAGRDRSIIKGKEEYKPVIHIESDSEIEVTLEGLTVTEAKGPWAAGILAGGKAIVIIRNSKISGNGYDGILMGDSSQAEISNSTISGNGEDGIWMVDSSQATISNSQISGNRGDGIWMRGSSQATISGSQISGNWDGILMWSSSQATISGSQISENGWHGISMKDSSQAEIRGSRFLGNDGCGIEVETKEARVRGDPLEMRGNGADLCGYAPASLRKPLVPQTEKTQLTVPGDYPSIQEAIDAIAPGGTITLAPGTYEVGLTIWKPLTLRGAGKEETVLKPLPNPTRRLIVSIIARVKVALEGLAVTGSKGDGLLIYGDASLKGLLISGNIWYGIEMRDSSQATISGSKISGNDYGISMKGSAQATISGSTISGNGDIGILMKGSAQATISGSKISGNDWGGILMDDSSQATISSSLISGNRRYGIGMGDSSRATIKNNTIRDNEEEGILMDDSSQATISDSEISRNYKDGIFMWESSQATFSGNEIFDNKGYGVALFQRPCFDTDWKFKGKVEGSGNEIHDNGKGDVCPEELDFLKTSQGGCYGPLCE